MSAKKLRKRFWTLDCETDPFKRGRIPKPFIWGAYEGVTDTYVEFNHGDEVVDFFQGKKVYVYAHNGGKFDFHFLRDAINADETLSVIGGRLVRFKVGVAEFRDSLSLLVNPLRAFAKDEIDYSKLEPDVRHMHMSEIRAYLRSDCVNLWCTLQAFFEKFGYLGSDSKKRFPLTLAGAAMQIWESEYLPRRYPKEKQVFWKMNENQSGLMREFYYGGRVQCFVKGVKNTRFNVADINSAYPEAMLHEHPFSPWIISGSRTLPRKRLDIGRCLIRLECAAHGVRAGKTFIGPFPKRTLKDELKFPVDNVVREYAITGWEYLAALENDAISKVKILEVHQYEQSISFADYILHYYDERLRYKALGDKVGDLFAKIMMNALYGKFAADPTRYHDFLIASKDSIDDYLDYNDSIENEFLRWKVLDEWGARFLLQKSLDPEKQRFYNVATAASITGYVRAKLFDSLANSIDPLYCDTDSIAARDISGLDIGHKLGQWKDEGEFKNYAIAGKKLYAFEKSDRYFSKQLLEWKAKGMKEDDAPDLYKFASKGARLVPSQLYQVAAGRKVRFEPEVPTFSFFRPDPLLALDPDAWFVDREIQMTAKDIGLFTE